MRFKSVKRRLLAAFAVLSAAGLAAWLGSHGPVPRAADHFEIWALLASLERECDPDSPNNDYEWSSNAPPTERRRMELLAGLKELGAPALAEVRDRRQAERDDEYGQMLAVAAAALGDESVVVEASKLMAWSDFPAVRICAAQVVRGLKDERAVEWFQVALHDQRSVRNDACATWRERFYPVRVTAELALRELGRTEDEIARWSAE